jgi:hypothetical protein
MTTSVSLLGRGGNVIVDNHGYRGKKGTNREFSLLSIRIAFFESER